MGSEWLVSSRSHCHGTAEWLFLLFFFSLFHARMRVARQQWAHFAPQKITRVLPPSITLLPVSSLFITGPPLPLFSLCGLCDAELTCRFGGNATLLSCDVKVATRRPGYIHATVGMDGRGSGKREATTSPVGPVAANEPLRNSQLHQQGQARDVSPRRPCDRVEFGKGLLVWP